VTVESIGIKEEPAGPGVRGVAVETIDGTDHQLVKVEFGPDGQATRVSQDNPFPVAAAPMAGAVDGGSAAVTTPGTPVQLGNHPCRAVTIQADPDNDGRIILGGATVEPGKGLVLPAGAAHSADVDNTDRFWIDATAPGAAVNYVWVT
jgi:hypothetical protein